MIKTASNHIRKSCVVVPLYKKLSDPREIASFKQGLKIFNSYPFIIVCPQSFNQSWLDEYKNLHPEISFEKFADENFNNVDSYSLLLLDPNFYDRFLDYEFMLIYQTDAYVFEDKLKFWCDYNFDYIGAPWTRNSNQWFKTRIDKEGGDKYGEVIFYPTAGNGGFSLRSCSKLRELMKRKVGFLMAKKIRNILRKTRTTSDQKSSLAKRFSDLVFFLKFAFGKNECGRICYFVLKNEVKVAEDIVFAIAYPLIFSDFKVAKAKESLSFSFESEPENLYQLNGGKLTFGCHAWYKISPEFWSKFIQI